MKGQNGALGMKIMQKYIYANYMYVQIKTISTPIELWNFSFFFNI